MSLFRALGAERWEGDPEEGQQAGSGGDEELVFLDGGGTGNLACLRGILRVLRSRDATSYAAHKHAADKIEHNKRD